MSFREHETKDIDLWRQWVQLNVPTLVLRRMESDVLPVETAVQMRIHGPKAKIVGLFSIGHLLP